MDTTEETRRTTYPHDALPASITRTLYIMYGVGRWNDGRIEIIEHESTGTDGFERVLLTTTEVTVDIPAEQDIKGKVLKVLEGELAKVRADNHMREKTVQEKIDNLLAIEYRATAA